MSASHDRGVDLNTRLHILLPLLALAAGCAANEPRPVARSGGAYVEEITSTVPRDSLLQTPHCLVR